MEPLIRFGKICKSFRKEKVLDDLNLDVFPNEIFGLVGRSGSGKSTLMRVLMGFYKPDSGKIIFEGVDITHDTHAIRKLIGLTTQENSFYDKLTIVENLHYYGKMYGITSVQLKSRIPQLIELMQLNGHEHSLAGSISGGMKRRLDFAISLVHDPPLLILDEPTTGLDPILRKSIWDIIWRIRGYGKTIIISTHFFDELQQHCSRIGVLNHGRIIAAASPAQYHKIYPHHSHFSYTFEVLLHQDDQTHKEDK
ncbi:MAG: ABC-2 type transport system ATP-binding protein [Candidatus Woesearchaeota archaeon]|jgi:ABC-2 type transport system ATP-binding protein